MASRLKKSLTVVAAKARRNSSFRSTWPSEAMLPVTEVPTLAPMIMGMPTSSGSAPAPTAETTSAVVVEEDWMIDVARMPMNTAIIGFDAKEKRSSAVSSPSAPKPSPMTPMATMSM